MKKNIRRKKWVDPMLDVISLEIKPMVVGTDISMGADGSGFSTTSEEGGPQGERGEGEALWHGVWY